jgi:transposase
MRKGKGSTSAKKRSRRSWSSLLTLSSGRTRSTPSNIAERTREGLEAARKRGRVGGRPPALSPSQRAEARRMRDEEGRAMGEIAALFEVSTKTIRRA